MTVYILARLVAWLYGFAWPLGRLPNGDSASHLLAVFSFITLPLEIVGLYFFVCDIIRKERNGGEQ